jgi:hypothetical protein
LRARSPPQKKSISPEKATDHFGWLGAFACMDLPAPSAWTRQVLDWHPAGPGLIADLARMDYSGVVRASTKQCDKNQLLSPQ